MLDGHTDQTALVVQLNEDVLVEIACFGNLPIAEVNEKRVGVGKVPKGS